MGMLMSRGGLKEAAKKSIALPEGLGKWKLVTEEAVKSLRAKPRIVLALSLDPGDDLLETFWSPDLAHWYIGDENWLYQEVATPDNKTCAVALKYLRSKRKEIAAGKGTGQ